MIDARFRFLNAILLVGLAGAASAWGGPYDTWGKRMRIRFALPLPGPVSDFPVQVVLDAAAGFDYADFTSPSDGADLRFSDATGEQALDYEIEQWDPAGRSVIWIKAPSIASTNDVIYAYWKKTGVTAAPCTTNGAVWAASDQAVYHMNENTGAASIRDFTANRRDAAVTGTARLGTAVSAGGQSFADASTYLTGPAPLAGYGVSNAFTLITWFKSTLANWQCLLSDGSSYADAYGYLFVLPPNGVYGLGTQDGWVNDDGVNCGFELDRWYCLVQRYNGATVDLFVDGVLKRSLPITGTIRTGARNLLIGRRGDGFGFQGSMDELRISSAALSDDWLAAVWLNQASNSGFTAFSEVLSTATSLTVNASAATVIGTNAATANGSLIHDGNTGAAAVFLCFGGADAGTGSTGNWAGVQAAGVFAAGQALSVPLEGLESGAAYAYRWYASNATGEAWSDAAAFRTRSRPLVLDLGFTGLGATRATLNGEMVYNGGEPATVLYAIGPLGEAAATNVVGVRSGLFAVPLSGLLYDTAYLYRIGASNSLGVTWCEEASFTTLANEFVWTGAGADTLASTPANWLQNESPAHATDRIRLDGTSSKDMSWDLTNAVAAWSQAADYTGTVTIATRFDDTFPALEIGGNAEVLGGTWTHPVGSSGNTEVHRLRVIVGGDFTLGTSAVINLDEKGFAANYYGGYGPGRSDRGGNYERGASHGGLAGKGQGDAVPWDKVYGSLTAPTNLGSSAAWAGGGALYLTVDGTAALDGRITATSRASGYIAAAAGGSVFIEAGFLEGAGTIDCSGGPSGGGGGAGGGGRIAVILSQGTGFGQVAMKAFGGYAGNSPDSCGAAGTIYRQHAGQPAGGGTLTIDNNSVITGPAMTMIPATEPDLTAFAAVILTNRGFLALNTNSVLDWVSQTNLLTYGPQQSLLMAQNTEHVTLSSDFSLAGFDLVLYTNLAIAGDMVISNGALTLAATEWPGLSVGGDLLIAGNASLTHQKGDERYRLTADVGGNLVVDAGGTIHGDGRGFGPQAGPGRGGASNNNWQPPSSHGGCGGYPDAYEYRVCYGSFLTPTNFGSGAVLYGGGALELHVAGATILNGSLSARGEASGLTGNAGGSVYLVTGTLEGNGTIDVSAGANWQYGGGGGRIAVCLNNGNTFGEVAMRANGGGGNPNYGAPGTIYRQTRDQGAGRGVLSIGGSAVPLNTATVTAIRPPFGGPPADALKGVTLEGLGNAYLSQAEDLVMGDLFLRQDSAILQLNGHTLLLKVKKHADWGTDARVTYDGGQILWTQAGTLITLY